MMAEPAIAAEIGSRFDHVLVDEYQDTNRLQASILLALKPDGSGLTVVGDDAQSIYSFRAATVRNILDFPGHFSPPAAIATLERNYRSTQPILAAANAVIEQCRGAASPRTSGRAASRPSARNSSACATNPSRRATWRPRSWRTARAASLLKSQAVLFRTSHHSAALEIELARRNIPFVKFGGLKFLEAAHVKDVLAFLRWAENLRDRVAGFRVLQLLPGAGPATAGRLLDRVGEAGDALEAHRDLRRAGGRSRALGRVRRSDPAGARQGRGLAGRARPRMPLVCAAPRSPLRRCRACGRPTSCSWRRSHPPIRAASAFSPSSRSIRPMPPAPRPACRCSTRTISSSPPSIRPRARNGPRCSSQRGRRLHPVRSRHRQHGRDRGGAAPALCRDDACARSPASRSCRSAFSRMRSEATATVTCMPRARASFRNRSSTASSIAPGRLPPRPPPPPASGASPSTSARGCAACGVDGNDGKGRAMSDKKDDAAIKVRRQWNDRRRIATYRLGDISELQWGRTSGGVQARTPQPFVHGYVMCDAMIGGKLAHSCSHGPAPHRIKVCLTRKGNEFRLERGSGHRRAVSWQATAATGWKNDLLAHEFFGPHRRLRLKAFPLMVMMEMAGRRVTNAATLSRCAGSGMTGASRHTGCVIFPSFAGVGEVEGSSGERRSHSCTDT